MSSPFGTRKSTGVWCRVAGGKIVRSAEETTPGAVKVEKKKNGLPTGEFKWELHDDTVAGTIIGFERKIDQYNGEPANSLIMRLVHNESGTQVNVQLPEGNRYWRGVLYRLLNLDVTLPITIAPYEFTPDGESKPKIGLNILQKGEKVPAAFSKDNPQGMPDATRVTFKGKERLDFTAQDEWLLQHVLLPVNAKLAEVLNAQATAPAPAVPGNDEELDDLPF